MVALLRSWKTKKQIFQNENKLLCFLGNMCFSPAGKQLHLPIGASGYNFSPILHESAGRPAGASASQRGSAVLLNSS